ncbi:DNA-directed RNA polymerase, mitochondrial [Anoplophora glabripennis]|nr:DNA-directed RNA polymerase, mitochondrial [Anoplophora glabripennis]
MYRLLKLSRTTLNTCPSNVSRMTGLSVSEKTCLLCKQLNNGSNHVRSQSTIMNPNITTRKKVKRRKYMKKYAELVVVTDKSSSQHKATVQKLTSTDIKLLAMTNLNLSELYKLKELSKNTNYLEQHTYNNLNVVENIPSTSNSSNVDDFSILNVKAEEKVLLCSIPSSIPPAVSDECTEFVDPTIENCDNTNTLPEASGTTLGDLDFESLKVGSTFQPEESEENIVEADEVREPARQIEKTHLSQKHRDEISWKTLASYIEVCSHEKYPQRGLNAFNFHRGRAKKNLEKSLVLIKNINVFNALLKGFASKGVFPKIREILKIMEEDEVELNLQSYVAIFECLGRISNDNCYLKDIKNFTQSALAKGITFDKMMNEGIFLNDEREIVLRAMRSYDQNYVPQYRTLNVSYKNHLLNHLNCDIQYNPEDVKYKNDGPFKPEDMETSIHKQIAMERGGYVTVKSIECRDTPSEEVLRYRQVLDNHYEMWAEAAQSAFNRDLATLTAHRSALNFEPYMRCIPLKDYIDIIIDEAKKIAQGSETYSPTVNMLHRDMGSKVYARYKILRKQKTDVLSKITKIHSQYCRDYAASHSNLDVLPTQEVYMNPRQKWQWIEHSLYQEGPTLWMGHQEWVPTILQFIGKFLYHIVMHDLKIDVNSLRNNDEHKNYLPAFYTIFRTQGRITKEEVKPHPVLSKLYRASLPETLHFPTYELPMICPPVPWTSTHVGGYLVSPCEVIRLPTQAMSQKQRLGEVGRRQLYPSLDSLNQLAAVPWKVNQRVLDVILQVFNSGGSSSLDVPEPPSSLSPPEAVFANMDKVEKYQLFRQKLQYKRKKAEMYSLWCDCLYRLSLANHFRNDVFWLPHNMDFRGRVYPVPPHLNHLGSDLARSMLIFAEPRPLGPEGLDWLKIHLINLTGLKKRDPISERLRFANDKIDLILDSADKPLTGKKWWMESDEPWQTLSCCMEIADVVRSPNPEEFLCHLPIHQDGSCNGLQHYAALGRDSAGAHSVNLTPSEVPQDVYSTVVALVEKRREKDAENGVEIAKILEGFVKRKVIKQTIMTTVYGVTRFGARLQIAKQLKDIDDFPKESVWAASSYLTGRTFESLRSMFTSTREIQDWFTECARLISAVGCQHVEWVTPLGLPIVQPYFKYKKLSMPNMYSSYPIDKYERPNVMKQKNAFPPNFIHSLDSSHMMLTSLHCERAGITFVSVHDCYWTHPSTVHIMNKICREQFVALHSEPILEDLSEFLCEKFSYSERDFTGDGSVLDLTKKKLNRVLQQLPKTGSFDIKQVLDSVYFFS